MGQDCNYQFDITKLGRKKGVNYNLETTLQKFHFSPQFVSRISGLRFCEASAKDNFNVEECFLKLVDDILAKMPLEIPSRELSNSILLNQTFLLSSTRHACAVAETPLPPPPSSLHPAETPLPLPPSSLHPAETPLPFHHPP
ncbi:unnamed protein product, partial [Oncorhynchus mykiss]